MYLKKQNKYFIIFFHWGFSATEGWWISNILSPVVVAAIRNAFFHLVKYPWDCREIKMKSLSIKNHYQITIKNKVSICSTAVHTTLLYRCKKWSMRVEKSGSGRYQEAIHF